MTPLKTGRSVKTWSIQPGTLFFEHAVNPNEIKKTTSIQVAKKWEELRL
jgi:hypothetical protein